MKTGVSVGNPDPKKHAILGASKAERWLECPGSIELEKKMPPRPDSSYAAEGTDAHACLEALLKNGPHKQMKTEDFLRAKYPEQMVMHARAAAQWIWNQAPKGAEIVAESRADLTHIDKDMWGTGDVKIVELFGTLHVIDYKYGAGVVVEPEENAQGVFYALAAAHEHDYNFEKVKITIIQPRAEHERGTIRTWETTIDNLILWGKKFQEGAKRVRQKNAPLKYGEKYCRWCTAKAICPEISKKALVQAKIDFEPSEGTVALPAVNPKGLLIRDLGKTLDACEKLETWISAVRDHAFDVLNKGGAVEGYKLVQKRSTRKWKDEQKAESKAYKLFGKAAFSQPELLSPAQLEKAVGKDEAEKFIGKYASSESSGLRLARASEPGLATSQIALDFSEPERQVKEVKSEVVGAVKTSSKTMKRRKR